MAQKQSYQWPELMATKTGFFWLQNIKFAELIKEPCEDAEQEIDIDFPFMENISIPLYLARKQHDFFITVNLN